MRKVFLVAGMLAAVSLGACTSSDSTDDDLQLGDRTEVREGPIEGQEGTRYGVEGYESYDQNSTSTAVPGTMEDLIVNVGDRVYFGYDRYDLTQEALNQLQVQARWMEQYPNVRIVVAGHADERGTREYNLALGDRRANSVRNYLLSLGVAANRITTISYGKEMPEVLGSNAQSWAQNRRAVSKVQ